jgi:hypothetical protein
MALLICKKHGGRSPVLTCPHISAAVLNAVPVEWMTMRTYTLEDLPDWWEMDCWYCRQCLEDFKLPESGSVLSGQMQDTFDKNLAGACPICFEEWRKELEQV